MVLRYPYPTSNLTHTVILVSLLSCTLTESTQLFFNAGRAERRQMTVLSKRLGFRTLSRRSRHREENKP